MVIILESVEIQELLEQIDSNNELRGKFLKLLRDTLDLKENKYHPLVFINGEPKIGENVCVGFFSEVNAKEGKVVIGDNCDIASFVSINVADSHKRCIGLCDKIGRSKIILENNVFVGSHSFLGGNIHIGHHSVVAAGTILINKQYIPPYSLIKGNPAQIIQGYYLKK